MIQNVQHKCTFHYCHVLRITSLLFMRFSVITISVQQSKLYELSLR